ncbi:DUF4167 domain-containing protein [Pseudovibrio sp. FO-BEG1]|uniref:DUF4167 domain-containing protein n=1 Tax=Pseudovibrio sp. (strain FO-BEG1) TaxID=911045 RepID=UPI001AD91AC0
MRPGNQNNKRMRGRGRKAPNPLTRTYESNGPDVKIRGTALHIAEKYQQLARDAQASGDRVTSENYYQHAEHYQRIVAAAQPQNSQSAAPSARAEEEAAPAVVEAPNGAAASEEQDVAVASTQPVIGLDTPQPFIEASPVAEENAEAAEAPAAGDEEDDKPRRRVRGTRGRGVRRTPSSANAAAPAEATEGGEDETAAPKPRRTPRARTPRAARTQRTRAARVPAEDAPAPAALETTGDGES